MLDIPSSALNGRYESPFVTQDVALALARKVTGLQRQIVLELRTPSPDREEAETILEQRRNADKDEKKGQPELRPTRDRSVTDAESTGVRVDILV
jgi:hypothetical protein